MDGAGLTCLSMKSSNIREVQVSHQRDQKRLDGVKYYSDPSVVTKLSVALHERVLRIGGTSGSVRKHHR